MKKKGRHHRGNKFNLMKQEDSEGSSSENEGMDFTDADAAIDKMLDDINDFELVRCTLFMRTSNVNIKMTVFIF